MHPAEEVIGAVGLTEMVVRPGDTSLAIGIGDLPIIAPSLLINLMEHAAILFLEESLEVLTVPWHDHVGEELLVLSD